MRDAPNRRMKAKPLTAVRVCPERRREGAGRIGDAARLPWIHERRPSLAADWARDVRHEQPTPGHQAKEQFCMSPFEKYFARALSSRPLLLAAVGAAAAASIAAGTHPAAAGDALAILTSTVKCATNSGACVTGSNSGSGYGVSGQARRAQGRAASRPRRVQRASGCSDPRAVKPAGRQMTGGLRFVAAL